MRETLPELHLPEVLVDSGPLLLRVEAMSALDDAGIQVLFDVVNLLVVAGSRGAFPRQGMSPAQSRLYMNRPRVESPVALVFELQTQGQDLRAFQLLRHMGERLFAQGIRVRSVSVISPAAPRTLRSVREVNEDNEFDAYPGCSKQLRFRTSREPVEDRRLRRAVIELRTRVSKDSQAHLQSWLEPWFELLYAGAYAAPLGPAYEVHCSRGTLSLFDELAVELCVDRFQASECAWYSMLNMLDACWSQDPQVVRVEID